VPGLRTRSAYCRGRSLATLPAPFDGFRHFAPLLEGDLLRFRDVGAFLVRPGGGEIAVDLDPAFDTRLLALPLLGPAIAILLHRLGHLVLHGSAVELGGKAEIFLGDKGAGKVDHRRQPRRRGPSTHRR
jgi:hypothetical protein